MRYTLALTFAIFALISNVSAVSESDVNDDPHVAADIRKQKEAAFRATYNEFDGQYHVDGSSYNKGDGIRVRGINKMAQMKKHHHHGKHHNKKSHKK